MEPRLAEIGHVLLPDPPLSISSALGRLRQEDGEFKSSLSHIARPCQRANKEVNQKLYKHGLPPEGERTGEVSLHFGRGVKDILLPLRHLNEIIQQLENTI